MKNVEQWSESGKPELELAEDNYRPAASFIICSPPVRSPAAAALQTHMSAVFDHVLQYQEKVPVGTLVFKYHLLILIDGQYFVEKHANIRWRQLV